MTQVDTDKKLEECLRQMCRKAAGNDSAGLSGEEKAYASGLEDALKLVCLHREQCEGTESTAPKTAEKKPDDVDALKLFQMSPEQVFKLNLKPDDDACLKKFSQDELVEAAFKFENELMACLGDANCIEWDIYAGLTLRELINVISRSVSDICRYNKG